MPVNSWAPGMDKAMRRKSSMVIRSCIVSGLEPHHRKNMPPHRTMPYVGAKIARITRSIWSLIRGLHLLGGAPGVLMGRAFTSIGIVALVGALGWWQTFYGEVHRLLGATCGATIRMEVPLIQIVALQPRVCYR
jgi:hypothetical protein